MAKSFYFLWTAALFYSCARKPSTQFKDPIPQHGGFSIMSKMLNEERQINVWLPPEYKNSSNSFPVLYMPDGGIDEDFPHIANSLSKLIASKSIPPFILIGIKNTDRRIDLSGSSETESDAQYCPLTDGAKNFRAFILDELTLEIEKRYRVTAKKGIIGESLAGLFVMETFFLNPSSFDYYMAMDPSLWWNNHYLQREAEVYLKSFPDKKTKLWFAGSSAKDISKFTNALAVTLKKSAPQQLLWKYSDEPNEKHHTIFRATKEKAMIWTLNEVK